MSTPNSKMRGTPGFNPWVEDPDWADDWADGEDWDHDSIKNMGRLLREHLGELGVR